jgi:hypothetical protein
MNWMDSSGPLNRYLPPVPGEAARALTPADLPPGAWILDPFAASPRLTIQLARAGYRVLVTAGNPLLRFLLDLAVHPPLESDLRAALAELAAARKDGERLELHLQSLYLTRCAACGREIPAEAFVWDSRSGELSARMYTCPACGDTGERAATPEDQARAAQWANAEALHRARALERVAARDDPDRMHAEEALKIYLPRAIYSFGTILNKLEFLATTDERRRCLTAILLYAFDQANSLWPHQGERPRPRQLLLPGVFRENNVWLALENGARFWAQPTPLDDSALERTPLSLWPHEPDESGGICLFEGPARDLAPDLAEIPLQAVVGVVPRPNQAFWSLSALWSGWIWGREAVGPFKAVLRRQRYDWQWHAEALRAMFASLGGALAGPVTVSALVPESEADFLSAVVLAGKSAGWDLLRLTANAAGEPAQVAWKKGQGVSRKSTPPDVKILRKILRESLEKRGQACDYLVLHAAVLETLIARGMLAWSDQAISEFGRLMEDALQGEDFIDLESRTHARTGTWALKKWQGPGLFDL